MNTGNRQTCIWVLLGQRTGDNAQALAVGHAVAEAVGGEVVAKPLAYNSHYRTPNLLLGATLRSLAPEARDRLRAPWPDLVVGVGRRSVPVARWIRAQSGGSAKLVQVGRPRAPLAWFDLVVTTPQYRLPEAANVLHLLLPPLPLPALDPGELARWRDAFAGLPRPWIGVLVGGARAPYRFDAEAARDLGRSGRRPGRTARRLAARHHLAAHRGRAVTRPDRGHRPAGPSQPVERERRAGRQRPHCHPGSGRPLHRDG
jgi:uncharacterized protein